MTETKTLSDNGQIGDYLAFEVNEGDEIVVSTEERFGIEATVNEVCSQAFEEREIAEVIAFPDDESSVDMYAQILEIDDAFGTRYDLYANHYDVTRDENTNLGEITEIVVEE